MSMHDDDYQCPRCRGILEILNDQIHEMNEEIKGLLDFVCELQNEIEKLETDKLKGDL